MGCGRRSRPAAAPRAPSPQEVTRLNAQHAENERLRVQFQQQQWEARRQQEEAWRQQEAKLRREHEQAMAKVQEQQQEEARRQQQEARRQQEEARRQQEEAWRQQEAKLLREHEQAMAKLLREHEQAMAKVEQELRCRKEELRRREQEAARLAAEQRRREEEARNYPLQEYQEKSKWEGSFNVGLVGNSGVGKSLLNNNIRGVKNDHPGWAPVGVKETTKVPTAYVFPPQEYGARIWDLPGAGTKSFPRDTYIHMMGLRHYDAVLVLSAGRFTETEILLLKELREHKVPHFAVRTKIDVDIGNNSADNDVDPEQTKRTVAEDLRQRGVENPYLVNSRQRGLHDFEKLVRDIIATVKAHRRGLQTAL